MASRRWWGAEGSRSRRELHQDTNKAEDVLEGLEEYDLSKRPEVRIINRYVRIRTCLMMVLRAVGSLALLWSTVVLLGGFVTLLKKVDFWYLTFIGFVQAAGIFNALADDQFIFVTNFLLSPIAKMVSWIEELQKHMLSKSRRRWFPALRMFTMILLTPVLLLSVELPTLCLVLSLYRLRRQDYGSADGDASKANLKPALNIFYSLAVAQSVLYIIWVLVESMVPALKLQLFNNYGYEQEAMDDYITETKRKCIRDMALAEDWNLFTYALRLLDSESPDSDDYCSGLRILQALIEEKVPVSQLLIRSSRQRIRKLIHTVGWRRPTDRETRELAARILAHLASDLSLSDFPGALESISSLLEIEDQESLYFPLRKNRRRNTKKSILEILMIKLLVPSTGAYLFFDYEQGKGIINNIMQGTKEELILQGLRIVKNLAHNERNCTEIYKNKDLFLKFTAPVSSDKFIEEVKTNGGCSVRVIEGTLKVVSRLVGAHGDTGKNMRLDIANTGGKDVSSSKKNMTIVSNLVAILGLKGNESNNNILGLQTRAIEIVAQLFRDESINLDRGERKKFIESLLHFFLSEEWMSEYLRQKRTEIREATTSQFQNNRILSSSPLLDGHLSLLFGKARQKRNEQEKKMEEAKEIASELKVKAGEALALLSTTGSQCNSDVIMNLSGCGDVLTKMLDSKVTTIKCTISGDDVLDVLIKIGCRISAAEILKHLCTHSTGDHTFHKMVLGKVLEELLHTNTTGTKPETGDAITAGSTSLQRANDEEDPRPPSSHHDEPQIPGSNKQKSDKRRFQAALLSLYVAIRGTWTDAAEFADLFVGLAGGDFPLSIKAIIMENSYATPACIAMLKITCEMVVLLVQHGRYVQEFKKEKIIDALSKASEAVASLEGCMLFAGMDVDCYGVPLKPVSSVLVERARERLNGNTTGAGENDVVPPTGRQ